MMTLTQIWLVDDDESVRESLPDLLKELGFDVQAFSSGEEFLDSGYQDRAGWLMLDIAMPGMSGLDVQQELARRRHEIPIIFITAHGDATTRPRMIANGAVDCLIKPFSETELVAALDAARERS